MYGSTSEDLLTWMNIHTRGWRSEGCVPNPNFFYGLLTSTYHSHMAQQKRWASGLFDILLSKFCPVFGTLFGKLELRQWLAYVWFTSSALRSIPEICYVALPAYCIITNTSFLPKVRQIISIWDLVSLN